MDISVPVSSIMSSDLKVLEKNEPLVKAKEIFETYQIHHIPIISYHKIVGVLSKSDLLRFMRTSKGRGDEILEQTRLNSWKAGEIMQTNVKTLNEDDLVLDALDLFKNNDIHCVPILQEEKLVGIVTPHDILMRVREEGIKAMGKEE